MSEFSENGIKRLACAVLKQAAYDAAQGGEMYKQTKSEVLRGGVDLYIAVLSLNLSRTEFIKKAKLMYPKKRRLSKMEMEVRLKCSESVSP